MTSVGKKNQYFGGKPRDAHSKYITFEPWGLRGRCGKSIPVERGDRDGEGRTYANDCSSTVVHRNVLRRNPSKSGFIPFLEGRGPCG